ncbi:MAG: 30S ribosomal protein S12 methylthiotransferase RimO [Prevotella sp.]|nr:30S ribosomal protein S12 methylthiotransferase RimO [Prevotella sp.]
MKPTSIDIISLGCSKNLVDSERLMAQLRQAGYAVAHDPEVAKGDICVVNTCGFIGDAKEESINVILEQGQRKAEGTLKKLFVMGCLSQRYLAELQTEIPEVDGWYGKFDWPRLLEDLGKAWDDCLKPSRIITTPSHYAYIKISEGCNRHCSYCAIPLITGAHVSRPMEEILEEVRQLVALGVKEFNVIAQELTFYGLDLYHHRAIAELIDQMADIEGVEWIRLHYAYPTDFPWELLEVINRHPNICRYLDIALQHISTPVLDAMRRHITKEETYSFVERIRREVPGIHLRTTLMVGHPGETEAAFDELLEFVRWARFERMGAFAYSEEEGTYSAEHYADDIPEDVKQTRLSKLMRLQQRISGEIQEAKVGTVQRVIIDRIEGDYYVGRTQFDSPEVDPEVLIPVNDKSLEIGTFYDVRITSSDDFDLYAEYIDSITYISHE